jgi:tetratricopeptide (TPR) repeat protein
MSERAAITQAPVRPLAAALGAVVAEALITLSAVFLDPPVSALVACHVGVGLLLTGWAWRRQDADASVSLLLAIATAGAGLFGALGMLAAMMADTRHPPEASAGEAAAEATAGEISKRLHESIVAGRELSGRSAGLASFRDILALGTFQDKQAALAIITRRFTPPLAPALRLALNDPDAAIRVQAATAAARIEDLFLAGLAQYTARVAERPDDPDRRLALARHLLGHAEAGLCPPERAAAELEQALSHLRQAVALAPLRRDIRLAIAKVQLRRRDPREAARHLESLVEPLSADEILTYGEALHQISGWVELRRLFRSAMVRTDLPSQVSRMAALWAIPSETV